MGFKHCTRCGQLKAETEFHKHWRKPGATRSSCKACFLAYTTARKRETYKHVPLELRRPFRRTYPPIALRLEARIERIPIAGCWLWSGMINRAGYGVISYNNKTRSVHRLMYELLVGPIGDGLNVCHMCDTPACCNPAHMFLGTQTENMRDAAEKGRLRSPRPKIGDAHPNAKYSVALVRSVKSARDGGLMLWKIADRFGITLSAARYLVYQRRLNDSEAIRNGQTEAAHSSGP